MLNRALRLMDGDIITRMGFLIGDLHRQIEQLRKEQYAGTTTTNTFTVYRGQGRLISFNNFLSTSTVRKVSLGFAQNARRNPDRVGVLFIMKINPGQSTTPFASIAGISDFEEEEEILFSMHSLFRIQDIKHMAENNRLYEVNLVLTADNDPELSRLTEYIRKESCPNSQGWYRLDSVLSDIGQFHKAEEIYQVLLDQTNDDENKAPIYHQLGMLKRNRGKYEEAHTFYEKSLALYQKTLHPNHPDLASSYNNIGLVYENMDNYSKARTFYERAVQIAQQSLPSNHPTLQQRRKNLERAKNK
ncbi:unnamed protein product [Adineta steineri]|uniref:Tetratricopeptide repeat protein n=1 Tax=Adineta steineri TaxID=433720 RepID=A0A819LLI2_9BILA|nr:unnamed protein product [Adineta steineri]